MVHVPWWAIWLKWLSLSVVVALLLTGCSTRAQERQGGDALVRFDRHDLATATKFVRDYKQHRGGYLLAVERTVEGAPIVTELLASRKDIFVRTDHSRDPLGTRQTVSYRCKEADIVPERGEKKLKVSSCEGVEGGETWLFGFEKR